MAQRRVSHLSFNFDSLTDLVTNLAGALIMIVLLFFGLSSKGVKQTAKEIAARVAHREGAPARSSSNTSALRVETAAIEAQLKKQQDAVEKLRSEIAEIDRKAAAMQPRESADPGGKPGKPALVKFRPPMLSNNNKSTGAVLLLMRNRVFFVGLADALKARATITAKFNAIVKEALRTRADLKSLDVAEDEILPSGDFNLRFRAGQFVATPDGAAYRGGFTFLVKADTKGETAEEAMAAGSHYHVLIDQLDPKERTISFGVFPDSFELFRTVRGLILDRKFNYNWNPISAGAEASFGSGGGVQ